MSLEDRWLLRWSKRPGFVSHPTEALDPVRKHRAQWSDLHRWASKH